MKRRHILNSALTGTVAGLTVTPGIASDRVLVQTVASPGLAQSSLSWRMATSYPRSLDIMFGAAELFCQRVSDLTNGRFVITPYPAGDLVPALAVLDEVAQGAIECGHTFGIYYIKQSPALAFSGGIPFGFTAQQQSAWLYEGQGLKAVRKAYQKFNVINFPGGNTGAQMGGWFQREIKQISDLKGLKMRISGLGGQVLTRLGAEVQMFAPDQIVDALVKGEIEAVEFVAPYDDAKLGLHKVAPFYYYPAWWQPSESQDVIINLEEWHRLPPQFQKAIELAAIEANILTLAKYNAANTKLLQRLKLEGVKLRPFNSKILETAGRETFALYEEIAEKDAEFREIYQDWQAFRRRIYQWHRINELSFAKFAFTHD